MLYKIKVWRTFHRKDTTQNQNAKIYFYFLLYSFRNLFNWYNFKFYSWIHFVDKLFRHYLYTVTVILDSLTPLQAIKNCFKAVVKVWALILVEHIQVKFEKCRYVLVAVLVTLKIKRLLIFL